MFITVIIDGGHFVSAIPYNQPRICRCAVWDSTGITFANSTMVGSQPENIFVDVTNAVYVSSSSINLVRIWSAENVISRVLSTNVNKTSGLFVKNNGDIYASSSISGQVIKWKLNRTNSASVRNFSSSCFSLFITSNNTLYCSIESQHQIEKTFLDDNHTNTSVRVAGTGSSGSLSNMLSYPKGIFVSSSLNLYVADCGNNRIQVFPFGELNGTTIPVNGSSGPFTLNCPTSIILDADDYLFIADGNNHRIIAAGPMGFRCVVGCSGSPGSAANQLNYPQSLAFDDVGNLFVVDKNNSRIQKFSLVTTICGKYSWGYICK